MATSQRVFIQEVAPRDGLQIEPNWVATDDKVALIDGLSRAGLSKIEVSSFVSPKAVPHLRDADEVFRRIVREPGVIYVALVPNLKGALRAIAAKADEINFVMSASETHNLANMRMSCEQSLTALGEIAAAVRDTPVALNAAVATAFGCPFEGPQAPEKVFGYVERYLSAGARSITLADTTGMANPRQVAKMVERFIARFGDTELTLHFHNTRGMGLANICAAFDSGAVRFDASLGGLGGCPFAPGATGNVCTEDVVHMFDQMGLSSSANLTALLALSKGLSRLLGHDVPGQVVKAGRSCDLHPIPAGVRAAGH
jgi:hydroxymethylglutaryl-CoA lyase